MEENIYDKLKYILCISKYNHKIETPIYIVK